MGDPDRLDSWKEIAAHLQRDVTTAQRWEKREGMPIHRHQHDKLGSAYAFRSELDVWARARSGQAVRNPLDRAQFRKLTNFPGASQAAAISRDGRLVAFASDRDGRMDVWITQIGTGQFHNLTHGRLCGSFVNPVLRTLSFSPDAAVVTVWVSRRIGEPPGTSRIDVWGIPVLGGEPTVYLEGVAEFSALADGSRLVYHVPAEGDPTLIRDPSRPGPDRQIYVAPDKLHAHFPLWSSRGDFVYFVRGAMRQGIFIDDADLWRIRPDGQGLERVTEHRGYVSHPAFLDDHTLAYLAKDSDGSGPWLYGLDVQRRVPFRLTTGLDRYTSLDASGDGRRLVATLTNPKTSLWRVRVGETPATSADATPISLTTETGYTPRLGPGYVVYVSSKGASEGIWKFANQRSVELWSKPEARIIGGPEVAPDGRAIAFSVAERGKTTIYVMNADGTDARVLTDALALRGALAWTPDSQAITSAADVDGTPHLFQIALDGASSRLVPEYALDPVWSPRGDFVLYSGPDIGATFALKAVTREGAVRRVPGLTLTRGARRLRFFNGQHAIVVMRGDIGHKDLWLVDLDTGGARQLTNLPHDFTIRDFDIAPDGKEILVERVQDQSDIVLIERGRT